MIVYSIVFINQFFLVNDINILAINNPKEAIFMTLEKCKSIV